MREGRLELTTPVERAVTYHDPCRLSKRLGVWQSPREILRAIPGLEFVDVDRVTQWAYCSGAGSNLWVEKPELTAEISRRRIEKAKGSRRRRARVRLPLVGAAAEPSRARRPGWRCSTSSSSSPRRPDSRSEMAIATLPETVIDELVAICGAEHVFTGASALYNRARVPAPFPVHRWEEHIPQAVVLPTSAEQISEVVRLANRHGSRSSRGRARRA